jgi:hypothetical protein
LLFVATFVCDLALGGLISKSRHCRVLIAAWSTTAEEIPVMDQRTFSVMAGVIFALMALIHLVRIYFDWPIVISTLSIPMWVSWVGFVIAGGLAYFGLRAARRQLF